ncbi:MAG TPA: sugar transferase [Planctomycetes bacterium]|nr:sugar transferase [Planctomycetota bacterium]
MLKEHATLFARLNQCADALAAGAAAGASAHIASIAAAAAPSWRQDGVLALCAAAALPLIARFDGLYESRRRDRIAAVAGTVGLAALKTAVVLLPAGALIGHPAAGAAAVLGAAAAALALVVKYAALHALLRTARLRGYDVRRVLVVGTSAEAAAYAGTLAAHGGWGLAVAGHLDERPLLGGGGVPAAWRPGAAAARAPVTALADVLAREAVDEVVFVLPSACLPAAEPYLRLLEAHGTSYRVISPLLASPLAFKADPVPSLVFEATRLTPEKLFAKRAFDCACASFLLLVLGPALAAIALAVRLCDGAPVLFSQERVGLRGRRFRLYKFRTMVPEAEALKAGLAARNEARGPVFKMRRDPRVTALGAFLRFFSLDELPQLFNVIRGDMSLVGPRPALPAEVAQYDVRQRRRLSVPPGMTCLWQVSGRSEIPFERWIALDLAYIDNWSFLSDLALLAATIPAVLVARGAR